MSRFIRILFINLILIFYIIFGAELFLFYKYDSCSWLQYYNTLDKHLEKFFSNQGRYLFPDDFRKPTIIKNTVKKPIILFGCSYTYGYKLEQSQIFSELLAKQSNRSVYNLGIVGASPRETLFIVNHKSYLYKNVPENTDFDYVIYTYITNQNPRLYTNLYTNAPVYKKSKDGNSLILYKPSFYYMNSSIHHRLINEYTKIFKNKTFDLFCLYMKEFKKGIIKEFGRKNKDGKLVTPQIVILVYDDAYKENWKLLEKEGFKIIKLDNILDVNILDEEYMLDKNDPHPNAKAWQVIVPALIKELNL